MSVMARTGRPPSDNPRKHAVPIRLTDLELADLKAAAAKAGMTVGNYIRTKALAAAKRQK